MISDDRNEMSSKTQNLEQIIIQVIFKCPQSANNIKAKPLSSSAEASLCCREAEEKEKESARVILIRNPSGSLCGGEIQNRKRN